MRLQLFKVDGILLQLTLWNKIFGSNYCFSLYKPSKIDNRTKKMVLLLHQWSTKISRDGILEIIILFSRVPTDFHLSAQFRCAVLFFLKNCLFTRKISFSNMMRFLKLIRWNLKGPQGTLRSGAKYMVILVIFYGSKIRKSVKVES